jgi:hypothetical protein
MLGYMADILTPAGVALGVLGVLLVLSREPRTGLFAIPLVTYLSVLFFSARASQLRYLMPAAFILTFFAARAVTLARSFRWAPGRIGVPVLAGGILALALLRGVDLTYAMIYDSRYAASEWIAKNGKAGDRIETFGAEFGLLPNTAPEIEIGYAIEPSGFLTPPRLGQEAIREITAGWAERKPRFIVLQPDHTSINGSPYVASCPPEIIAALGDGSLGYVEGAYFQTPALLPWVARPDLDYPTVNPPIRIFVPVT